MADLAEWMLRKSGDWDHLSAKEQLEEMLHLLDKPHAYVQEYALMRGHAFRCCDCGGFAECRSETQHERALEGDEQRCPDCDEQRRAEAWAS